MMVYVSVSQKRLVFEKYIVTNGYCTLWREGSIGIGRQTIPEHLIWNLVCCTRAVTVFLSVFSMWSDACCHVPSRIPLAVRAVAVCANMHKIKVYSVPFLGAAVLMRNATVSICDRITDGTYLTIP